MTEFTDELFCTLGAWQNGWQEDQSRRNTIATKLEAVVANLPKRYRVVSTTCYRKRFLHTGELVDIILKDEKPEGLTSWTTDLAYAERFKGLIKADAVNGAIFEHLPTEAEVVVNIGALWASPEFVKAAEAFRDRNGRHSEALFNFRDRQGEVVLDVPLRGSEILSFTGVSSPFDALCDLAGIPEQGRDTLFRKMLAEGAKIGEPRYTPPGGAQRALKRIIESFKARFPAAGF